MKTAPASLSPEVLAALHSVYPNWDRLSLRSRQMLTAWVLKDRAKGERAWCQSRPIVGTEANHYERAHVGDKAPVIGYRDYFITPTGDIETVTHIRKDLLA